jgi:beta-glucosidase-like glycosyl hydrolase
LDSIGTYDYNFWSEATHGVATFLWTYKNPTTTNFPFPITTAMAFNRSLWWHTGQHIAREARALMNAGHAWSTFWTPVINLAREPRWGRNLETPGV